MSFKERIQNVTRGGWIRAAVWGTLYVAFVIWVCVSPTKMYSETAGSDWGSLAWLLLLPLVLDAFTTKYINYNWWKKYKPAEKGEPENPDSKPALYALCSWIDAIVFALVAVYFINLYVFQNYQIPSSSLEKTLRVGDFLFVSKMSYGARVPNTPLSMPLVQHTFPEILGGGKSYIDRPHWDYKRLRGWDSPHRGDIVVFNFPTGDTVCLKMQNPDYYTACYYYGRQTVHQRKDVFGDIVVRPIDRRENYVKRCVGEPGDNLQIIDNVIYINGVAENIPGERQLNYIVQTDGHLLTASYMEKVGINKDDRHVIQPGMYHFPLTDAMRNEIEKNPHVVRIDVEPEQNGGAVYPLGHNDWTRDNYGPIYIPRRGETIMITEDNYWLYRRIADAYEFKPMSIGEPYTFEMDYYWMMGDNRHNSADSRYWGFVPEDHIVGRPVFVWLSIEKDNPWFKGHIRWNRIGNAASK